jgi:HK97 family phage portal protein
VALLHDFIDRYVWPVKRSGWLGYQDAITDANGQLLTSIFSLDNVAGEVVTERNALQNATVFTCTNVRGNTIASLPCNVIQERDNKKQVLTDHAAYYLISQEPNSYMTAATFWKTVMLHVDVWGNAYAYINRDSRQRPSSLDMWEPWNVSITQEGGQLWYRYNGSGPVPGRDVLHYRFYTWDGICGRSPVLENRQTIGMAMKLDRYSAQLMASRPPGVLSYEGNLNSEQRAENKKQWNAGGVNDVKILSGRWSYQPIMSSANDTSFTTAKQENQKQLCAIWQMPPTFVQDFSRATFSNAEQMDLVYAKHTVTPICRAIELENNMKLFFEREKMNTYTKFNMNGLLRGDLAARQSFYQSMVNTGIMKRNEARSLEDLNPYDGGDVPLIQGAMIPADEEGLNALREQMATKVLPTVQEEEEDGKTSLNGKHKINGGYYVN